MEKSLLSCEDISKRFPGVMALEHVSFSLRKGEVHALVGENGAGKSTLMNILGGILRPDTGDIWLDGEKVSFRDPLDSLKHGIGFVHQESNLLPNLTVTENVFLSRELLRKDRSLHKNQMRQEILRTNQRLGYKLDPDKRVGDLSLSEQQCVEIMRALLSDPKILILDEPTAALDKEEVQRLYRIIHQLCDGGVSIIYISHRLDEVMYLADRATVLKDGRIVGTLEKKEIQKDRMISMMVGRVLENIYPDRTNVSYGAEVLKVENLTVPGKANVSFSVRAGEIVGFGGLEGHGQRAVLRAIFGDIPYSHGNIRVDGQPLKKRGIASRIKSGIAYVTNDRRGEGLILTMSLRKNTTIAALDKLCGVLGVVRAKSEKTAVDGMVDKMQIKTASVEELVGNLSGGNQQKVMLSRWLMTEPKVLIIDEPTKGVDVGARMSVYRIIHELTQAGIGILMFTSDMMELIGLSDRIMVFYEGEIAAEFDRKDATEEKIMRSASGILEEGGGKV